MLFLCITAAGDGESQEFEQTPADCKGAEVPGQQHTALKQHLMPAKYLPLLRGENNIVVLFDYIFHKAKGKLQCRSACSTEQGTFIRPWHHIRLYHD